MNLSRKWLGEFVDVDVNDKDFAEIMTIAGSQGRDLCPAGR